MYYFLYENHWGSLTLTLLNVLNVPAGPFLSIISRPSDLPTDRPSIRPSVPGDEQFRTDLCSSSSNEKEREKNGKGREGTVGRGLGQKRKLNWELRDERKDAERKEPLRV